MHGYTSDPSQNPVLSNKSETWHDCWWPAKKYEYAVGDLGFLKHCWIFFLFSDKCWEGGIFYSQNKHIKFEMFSTSNTHSIMHLFPFVEKKLKKVFFFCEWKWVFFWNLYLGECYFCLCSCKQNDFAFLGLACLNKNAWQYLFLAAKHFLHKQHFFLSFCTYSIIWKFDYQETLFF